MKVEFEKYDPPQEGIDAFIFALDEAYPSGVDGRKRALQEAKKPAKSNTRI